jgi:hypothetical protein
MSLEPKEPIVAVHQDDSLHLVSVDDGFISVENRWSGDIFFHCWDKNLNRCGLENKVEAGGIASQVEDQKPAENMENNSDDKKTVDTDVDNCSPRSSSSSSSSFSDDGSYKKFIKSGSHELIDSPAKTFLAQVEDADGNIISIPSTVNDRTRYWVVKK